MIQHQIRRIHALIVPKNRYFDPLTDFLTIHIPDADRYFDDFLDYSGSDVCRRQQKKQRQAALFQHHFTPDSWRQQSLR
jgi:hypothetical protein